METIDDTIYFESDDEFTDFCVAPYAVIKQSEKGGYYVAGEYSDEYLKCVEMGKNFVIKDEDSVVLRDNALPGECLFKTQTEQRWCNCLLRILKSTGRI